jgi:hypothetical protein
MTGPSETTCAAPDLFMALTTDCLLAVEDGKTNATRNKDCAKAG